MYVSDLSGKVRRLYQSNIIGTENPALAWSPSGEEVWFTVVSPNSSGMSIHAVTLSGELREILPMTQMNQVLDISKDGRILLAHGTSKTGMVYFSPEQNKERDLSWLDGSQIATLSDDGRTILFTELEAAGKLERAVYVRKVDETEAVRLGDGYAVALSPDGRWALSILNHSLILLPTGPGQSRIVNSLKLDHSVGHWFPDGKRILFYTSQFDHARLYVQDIDHGEPQAISEEGIWAWGGEQVISPDRKWVIAVSKDGYFLYSIEDRKHKAIPAIQPNDSPIRWSEDGKSIYVTDDGTINPIKVYRLDLGSPERKLWKEIIFSDPAGINYRDVFLTPNARTYAYTYGRTLTDLYLIEGLK